MDFSDALRAVKDGKRVRRAMWDERFTGLGLTLGDVHTDAGATFSMLLCDYPTGTVRPFSGSNWDLLAGDWELA